MSGTVRVDWQAIKAKWGSEVGELHLALLPKGAAQLLLAIADRLHWEATYRIEGYDFADWDELQAIVDLGLGGLTDTVRLSDVLAYWDEVEPLLRQIRDRPCCGETPLDYLPNPNPGSGTIAPVGPEDEVPDLYDETDFIANPPLTPWTDADGNGAVTLEEMEDYLCRAFNWYYDLLIRWLNYIKLYAQLGGLVWEPIDAIITVVLSRYKGLPNWVTMVQEVADVLITLWPDITAAIANDLINAFQENRTEIICAIQGQTTMADVWTVLSAHIETILTTLGYSSFSLLVSWPTWVLAVATHGFIDLDGENNVCDCPIETISFTFDNDVEGFVYRNPADFTVIGPATFSADDGSPNPGCLYRSPNYLITSPLISFAAFTQLQVTLRARRVNYGAQWCFQSRLFLPDGTQVAAASGGCVSTPSWVSLGGTFNYNHPGGNLYFGLYRTSSGYLPPMDTIDLTILG